MSIRIYWGPMFSGKTSCAQQLYVTALLHEQRVVFIKHSSDKRYSEKPLSVSHDSIAFSCITYETLEKAEHLDVNLILIDEAQFFQPDHLRDFCLKHKKSNVDVCVFGLNCNTKGQIWEAMAAVLPFADTISVREAACIVCNEPCKRTRLRVADPNAPNVRVGADDIYVPCCEEHQTTEVSDDMVTQRANLLRVIRTMKVAVI